MAQTISGHNKRVIGSNRPLEEDGCNCTSQDCVLDKKCLTENVVYKGSVTTKEETKEYIGLTSNTFKQRYYQHNSSFNNPKKAHTTTLATYIWKLQNKNTPYNLS